MAAADPSLPDGLVLLTHTQTAGRGQRGNSWEADPGCNVTLSILFRHLTLPAAAQFELSRAVALAVASVVTDCLPPELARTVAVKWPNDIYVGDRKIAGILIELALAGSDILYAVAGIGLNVNQPRFNSDAPNPVSLFQLTSKLLSLDSVTRMLVSRLRSMSQAVNTPEGIAALRRRYAAALWRGTGVHDWRLPDGSVFRASVRCVEPDGHLVLDTQDGCRRFAFKEVFPVV